MALNFRDRASQDALFKSGISLDHAEAIQRVVNEENAIISIRCVATFITALYKENYATKSFHIKAKSCAWGPMAGFVLSDPSFHKHKPDPENIRVQRESLYCAFHTPLDPMAGASPHDQRRRVTPLRISHQRVSDLEHAWNMIERPACRFRSLTGEVERIYEARIPETNIWAQFRLVFEPAIDMWRVKYYTSPTSIFQHGRRYRKFSSPLHNPANLVGGTRECWVAGHVHLHHEVEDLLRSYRFAGIEEDDILALVSPHCPREMIGKPESASIADYDLHAIYPHLDTKKRKAEDQRLVKDSNIYRLPKSLYIGADEHRGNTTPRITGIIDKLNRSINYGGGLIVHHGDEAGRPFVHSIDFPFIAFVPTRDREGPQPLIACVLVENVPGFRAFISQEIYKGGFSLDVNPGWMHELGMMRTMQTGSYEV